MKVKLQHPTLRSASTATALGRVAFDEKGEAELEVDDDGLARMKAVGWFVAVVPHEAPPPPPPPSSTGASSPVPAQAQSEPPPPEASAEPAPEHSSGRGFFHKKKR